MSLQTKVFNSVKSVGYTLRLTLTENSTNTANNSSEVNYKLDLISTTAKFTDFKIGWKITLGGSVVSEKARTAAPQKSIGNNSSITIASGNANIAHDSDGKKTISVAFSIDMSKTSYTPGAMSVTGESMILTAIPRATTPSITGDVIIGQSITVNLPRASGLFTHTLKYSFGALSGTIGTGYGTNAQWVVPTLFANQIPSAVSGSGSIICETYNGTSLIGTKQIKFTAKVPNDAVPDIASVNITEAVEGISEHFHAFLQNRSKLRIETSAVGAMGSTVKTIEAEVDGVKYIGENVLTEIISSGGNVEVNVKAVDSRGRTKTKTVNISVKPYAEPFLVNASAVRANQNGVEDEEGEYLSVNFEYIISSVNNLNNALMLLECKKLNETSFSVVAQKYDYSFSGNITSVNAILHPDDIYEIRIILQDYFGNVYYNLPNVPTAFTLVDYHNGGQGISFGRVCKTPGMHVYMPIDFNGVIQSDFVCEQGTCEMAGVNGTWMYRKWNSGIAECFGRLTAEKDFSATLWGSIYTAIINDRISYPFPFTDVPIETVTARCDTCAVWVYSETEDNRTHEPLGVNTLTQTAVYVAARATAAPGTRNITLDISVKGLWK